MTDFQIIDSNIDCWLILKYDLAFQIIGYLFVLLLSNKYLLPIEEGYQHPLRCAGSI